MLEHGTVYLVCNHGELPLYLTNRFSRCHTVEGKDYITTNMRVLAENKSLSDLKYLSNYVAGRHELRITVHFTTQISITREYNRHRANSMAEQSTRYCNYTKNKFGNEITINLPEWVSNQADFDDATAEVSPETFSSLCQEVAEGKSQQWSKLQYWLFANLAAEYSYMNMINAGCKPQEARAILPLDCNTELVHTAFISDWRHFFDLRALGTTGAPQNQEVLTPFFERSGYNSVYITQGTNEWLQQMKNGTVVSCSRTGGQCGFQLYGISRWTKRDSFQLRQDLELEFIQKHNHQAYWDDVAMFCHPDHYQLGIFEMSSSDVIEIDSIKDLEALNESLLKERRKDL